VEETVEREAEEGTIMIIETIEEEEVGLVMIGEGMISDLILHQKIMNLQRGSWLQLRVWEVDLLLMLIISYRVSNQCRWLRQQKLIGSFM
jgi:hypothetical protein